MIEISEGMKIVEFDKYCKKCYNEKTKENEEPCYSCLHEPARQNSHKPARFQEKSGSRK